MTRLEEIEALLTGAEPGFVPVPKEMLLYALDCYRARVAVLEEALSLFNPLLSSHEEAYRLRARVIALTPEECLERQSRTHKESLLIGEEG